MGKVTYSGLMTEEDLRTQNGFVLSYGQVLKPGSAEHLQAIAEAHKGDHKHAKYLLAQLPNRTPNRRQ